MTFDEFLPYVMPELPGVPLPLLVNEAGTVLDEFCRASHCWTETLDPVTMQAGVDVYDFELPPGALVHVINAMHAGGHEMTVTDRKQLFRQMPDWQTRTAVSPAHYIRLNNREFQVVPKPHADGVQVLVEAVLVPKLPLASLPDAVMRDHQQAIVAGVKFRLMAQAKKPWSDPVTAAFHKTMHDAKLNDAITQRMHGYTAGDVYVKPQTFGLPPR